MIVIRIRKDKLDVFRTTYRYYGFEHFDPIPELRRECFISKDKCLQVDYQTGIIQQFNYSGGNAIISIYRLTNENMVEECYYEE